MNKFDREKIKPLCNTDEERAKYQRHIDELLDGIEHGQWDTEGALWHMTGYVESNTLFIVQDYLEQRLSLGVRPGEWVQGNELLAADAYDVGCTCGVGGGPSEHHDKNCPKYIPF